MSVLEIRVPASSANVGPGFDTLALAVDRWLHGRVEAHAASPEIALSGEGADTLPRNAENLIVATAERIAGPAALAARWEIASEIPLTRGLGSSAAATTFGVIAGHWLRRVSDSHGTNRGGEVIKEPELFAAVAAVEGHADNAAAAVYGGVRGVVTDGGAVDSYPIGCPSDAALLLVIPEVPLSTKAARGALPDVWAPAAVVANLQHITRLTHALAAGDWDRVRASCTDTLHEPYRLPLVPGLADALSLLREHPHGRGAFLSGAGPTLAAFVDGDSDATRALGDAAVECLVRAGTPARATTTAIPAHGASWTETQR